MKVKIPRKIKGGTHPYKIKFESNLIVEDNRYGYANHVTQIIAIDTVLAPSQRDVTLIHEVLECINRNYSCRLDDDNIDRIAHGFNEFLENLGIKFDWSLIEGK